MKYIKELFNLFKELDLFNANTFEDFSKKFENLENNKRVELINILKMLYANKPQAPKIEIDRPLPPKVNIDEIPYDDENEENDEYDDFNSEFKYHISGFTSDPNAEFKIDFNPSDIDFWDHSKNIAPRTLSYFLREYYGRFLQIMNDYFGIEDFENASANELFDLFLLTGLIDVVSYNPQKKEHRIKRDQLVFKIHQVLINESGDKRGS